MSGRHHTARIWVPLALAGAMLALREGRSQLPGVPTPEVRATELPIPQGSAQPKRRETYDLDPAKSCVRFFVEGANRDFLLSCAVMSGTLELHPDPTQSLFELRIDLGSLSPERGADANETESNLQHLLGVHRGSEIVYRGTLLSAATSPLPSLHLLLWQGTLRVHDRALRQPMALWQTTLPGQPLRLQGHGTVGTDGYGLPRRSWFGLLEERHAVTLGLDLAWKRRPAR